MLPRALHHPLSIDDEVLCCERPRCRSYGQIPDHPAAASTHERENVVVLSTNHQPVAVVVISCSQG